MATVTLNHFDMMPVHCPFCGTPSAVEGPSLEVEGCEHLMYITAADFFIFVSKKLDPKILQLNWKIDRADNGLIEIEPNDEDDDVDLSNALDQSGDIVIFEQNTGPPALHITNTAFVNTEQLS